MGVFKKLFQNTLTYKIYDTFSWGIEYIKDRYGDIGDTLYSDEFNLVLKRYLNKSFKKDWIGRLYAIINPNIDINGKMNLSNSIIEINDEMTNNDEYVKAWMYKQMHTLTNVFNIQSLGDYIDATVEHKGPASEDNFLVVFDLVSRKAFASAFKRMFAHLFVYAVIAAIALIIIF